MYTKLPATTRIQIVYNASQLAGAAEYNCFSVLNMTLNNLIAKLQ